MEYRPSRGSKQLLARLTYVPRASQFESSGQDAFRGFYALFWIAVGIMMLRTYVSSFDETGYPLSLSFAALFSKDALTLALSDAVLVGSTAIVVPFMKLIAEGYIRYSPTGIIIQHLWQALMLGVAVQWTFNRWVIHGLRQPLDDFDPLLATSQWEWVQSGFFTLHCLVMLMKMHSYCSVNGTFAAVYHKKQALVAELDSIVDQLPGGKAKAEMDASDARTKARLEAAKSHLSGAATPASVGSEPTPAGTPLPIPNGIVVSTESVDPPSAGLAAPALRNRLARLQPQRQTSTVPVDDRTPNALSVPMKSNGTSHSSYFPSSTSDTFPPNTVESDPSVSREGHPLVGHPDSRVNGLAMAIGDLEDEITSTGINGKGRTRFPENVTLWNFVDYQMIPTLVYELEYPRTDR